MLQKFVGRIFLRASAFYINVHNRNRFRKLQERNASSEFVLNRVMHRSLNYSSLYKKKSRHCSGTLVVSVSVLIFLFKLLAIAAGVVLKFVYVEILPALKFFAVQFYQIKSV